MVVDWIVETEPERESWTTPIRDYLQRGILQERRNKRRKILRQASRYIMQEGILYMKGFSVPMCVTHDEVKRVLREVHEGACGNHIRGQTLAKKFLRYRYL